MELVSTAVLAALLLGCGVTLVGEERLRRPTIPWFAIAITSLAVVGLVVQHAWAGATTALDADPSRAGWWRHGTATFLQNGGAAGTVFNLVTLAAFAALAEWAWGTLTAAALFVAGIVVPAGVGALLAVGPADDPRGWMGSSGATLFLAGTLGGALLVRGPRGMAVLALVVAAVAWFVLGNAHGLVACYGTILGGLVEGARVRRAITRRRRRPSSAGPAASPRPRRS